LLPLNTRKTGKEKRYPRITLIIRITRIRERKEMRDCNTEKRIFRVRDKIKNRDQREEIIQGVRDKKTAEALISM